MNVVLILIFKIYIAYTMFIKLVIKSISTKLLSKLYFSTMNYPNGKLACRFKYILKSFKVILVNPVSLLLASVCGKRQNVAGIFACLTKEANRKLFDVFRTLRWRLHNDTFVLLGKPRTRAADMTIQYSKIREDCSQRKNCLSVCWFYKQL